MKENNVVMFDISRLYKDAVADPVVNTASDDVVECIMFEYMKVYHEYYAQINRGEFSHVRQSALVMDKLVTLYGVYTSNNATLELRRRLPNVYNALTALINTLIKAFRELIKATVPREFIGYTYAPSIMPIRTKTWGMKYFLMYSQDVETLKWPQSLSK